MAVMERPHHSPPPTGISIGGSRPDLQQYVEFLKLENAYRRKKDESRDSRDKSIIEVLLKDLEYDESSRRDIETGFTTNGGSSSRPVASQPVIGAAVSQGLPAGSSRMNLSYLPAVTHGYTTGGLAGEVVAEGDAAMRDAGLRFNSSVQNVDDIIDLSFLEKD